MGDRRALMEAAVSAIHSLPDTRVIARSATYRSAPDGPVPQDWYANLALVAESDMTATEFANAARKIEATLGRRRDSEIAWGPRPMDIDVIAWGQKSVPALAETMGKPLDKRPFVIIPLAEIAPDVSVDGSTFSALAMEADSATLERLDWPATIPSAEKAG